MTVTHDITRKTHKPSGRGRPRYTNAYKLARFLQGKKNGATRQEIMKALGFEPAPYPHMYDCFIAVDRGRYKYVGKNLKKLA